MFYEVDIPEKRSGTKDWTRAMVALSPSESRRLPAKATVALPEVRNALERGIIIIGRGVTTANSGPPPCPDHVIKKGKVGRR
jgi:hypothetical protein